MLEVAMENAVIDNSADRQQTPEQEQETRERLLKLQEQVAKAMLKSDEGWEILRQFYNIGSQKILATSVFVVPVLQNKRAILDKLNDPAGFEKSFATLTSEISRYKNQLVALWSQHSDRRGRPTDLEHVLIFQLSEQYNQLLSQLETVMEPLMFSLIDTVRTEFGPDLLGPAPQEENTHVNA